MIQDSETPPYTIDTTAQVVGAVGSVLLTIGLVVLYERQAVIAERQTDIQEGQEELMRADYEPRLKASVGFETTHTVRLEIHNTGKAAAHDVRATWRYGGKEFNWYKSVIQSGEMVGFLLKGHDGDHILEPDDVREFFSHLDSENIEYRIEFSDTLGRSDEFEDEIEVIDVIDSRTSVSELKNSPEIAGELSNINDSLESIEHQITDYLFRERMPNESHTHRFEKENNEERGLLSRVAKRVRRKLLNLFHRR